MTAVTDTGNAGINVTDVQTKLMGRTEALVAARMAIYKNLVNMGENLSGAKQGKMSYMGDVDMGKRTQDKGGLPFTEAKFHNRYVQTCMYGAGICLSEKQLESVASNPDQAYMNALMEAFDFELDRDFIDALCGSATTGEDCNQRKIMMPPDQFLANPDGTCLTPKMIRCVEEMLFDANPGSEQRVNMMITNNTVKCVGDIDEFKNADVFSNDLNRLGLLRGFSRTNFRVIGDRRRYSAPGEKKLFQSILKLDKDAAGENKHVRYLIATLGDAVSMHWRHAMRTEVVSLKTNAKSWLDEYKIQTQGEAGFMRLDECKVVVIPVVEDHSEDPNPKCYKD